MKNAKNTDAARCFNSFEYPRAEIRWNFWQSDHPVEEIRVRQELEWTELTIPQQMPPGSEFNATSRTGLTGGLLRLGPDKQIPLHWHPPPYGETYFFTRGDGVVSLGGWEFDGEGSPFIIPPSREVKNLTYRIHTTVPIAPGYDGFFRSVQLIFS